MDANEAARALGTPLNYVRGRPGKEVFLAFRNIGGSGLFTRRTGSFCNSAKAGWPAGRATGAITGCGNSGGFAIHQNDFGNPKHEGMTRGTGYQTDGFGRLQNGRLSRRSRRRAEGGHRGDPGDLWRQSPHPLGLRPAGGRGLCRDRAIDLRPHRAELPVRLFA